MERYFFYTHCEPSNLHGKTSEEMVSYVTEKFNCSLVIIDGSILVLRCKGVDQWGSFPELGMMYEPFTKCEVDEELFNNTLLRHKEYVKEFRNE